MKLYCHSTMQLFRSMNNVDQRIYLSNRDGGESNPMTSIQYGHHHQQQQAQQRQPQQQQHPHQSHYPSHHDCDNCFDSNLNQVTHHISTATSNTATTPATTAVATTTTTTSSTDNDGGGCSDDNNDGFVVSKLQSDNRTVDDSTDLTSFTSTSSAASTASTDSVLCCESSVVPSVIEEHRKRTKEVNCGKSMMTLETVMDNHGIMEPTVPITYCVDDVTYCHEPFDRNFDTDFIHESCDVDKCDECHLMSHLNFRPVCNLGENGSRCLFSLSKASMNGSHPCMVHCVHEEDNISGADEDEGIGSPSTGNDEEDLCNQYRYHMKPIQHECYHHHDLQAQSPVDDRALHRMWLDGHLSDLIQKAYSVRRQPKFLLDYKCTLQEVITRCLASYLTERFKVYLIGSSLTCVGTGRSDVDLCMVIYDRKGRVDERYNNRVFAEIMLEKISIILEKCSLAFNSKVIRANVPILKFYDHNHVEVNLNLNKLVTVQNTMLLMHCCSLDSRVAPFLLTVKLWAQKNGINCAYFKSLSSYSLSLMAIYFLQNVCQPPILPPFDRVLEAIRSSTGLFFFNPTRKQARNTLASNQMYVTSSANNTSNHSHHSYSLGDLTGPFAAYPHAHHYPNHSKNISKVSYVHSNSLSSSPTSTCSSSSSDGENVSETSSQCSAQSGQHGNGGGSRNSNVQFRVNVPAAMAMTIAAQKSAKEAAKLKRFSSVSNSSEDDDNISSNDKLLHLNYFAYYYQYCQQNQQMFQQMNKRLLPASCKSCETSFSDTNSDQFVAHNGTCDTKLCDKFQRSTSVDDDDDRKSEHCFQSANTDSLGHLFAQFIDFYSNTSVFDNVISVRTGQLMKRTDPIFARSAHTSMDTFICVEEPFNHTNTSHSVHNDFMFNFIVKSFHWTRDSIAQMKTTINDLV